jgi:cell division protease FtsH
VDRQPKPPERGDRRDRKNTAPSFVWWVMIAVLMSWVAIWLTRPHGPEQTAISYSKLVDGVKAGNVSSVTISGDQITGTYLNPKDVQFSTTFPQTVGDREFMPLLRAHGVTVNVTQPPSPIFVALLNWLPFVILMGIFLWMIAGSRGQMSPLAGFTRAKARRYEESGQPKVTFADVAGVDEAKDELQEEVDFLRHPQKYRDIGARIPKGVLLVGAPGTGKTLLARAVAGESGAAFFSLNASEFVEMFVGVGASRVRDLFSQAKSAAPAIVFIDELDSVGRRRGAGLGTVNDEREQTLNQLLAELDGFDPRIDVIILAATNRPDVLDPALLRPGRFDRQVTLDLPDRDGREAILKIHTAKLRLASDIDLALLARTTIGQSGADLANLCNEAALNAARADRKTVTMHDFEQAQDKLRLGIAHPRLADPGERKVIAYHESGHALMAWLTPEADPVQKITIIPHGRALGHTQQVPDIERHNLSLTYLRTRIAVLLGGRTAEEIMFEDVTTGAESDLVEATALARRMVARWGMGELGLFAVSTDEEQPFLGYEIARKADYSEATAARIDADVARILAQAHEDGRRVLLGARAKLDALAQALLQVETIDLPELERILGPRATVASTTPVSP